MIKENTIILFSGYNQRSIIAFLRTIDLFKDLDIAIIASNNKDPIFLSKYKTKVVYTRKEKLLSVELFRTLKKILGFSSSLILPSTEALNRFVLNNREVLLKLGYYSPLVSKLKYETISDKIKFTNLVKQHSLQVPQEYSIEDEIIFPCVLKPKKYFSGDNKVYSPQILRSNEELAFFLEGKSINDFTIQKYIEGDSYYLLYYFYKNGNVRSFSQKNIIQQSGGKSMIACESARIHQLEVSRKYEELFLEFKFNGLVMVELKRDNSNNYFMIEANPRFWGPSQLFVDCNVNLFFDFLFENSFIDRVPRESLEMNKKYFWTGGIMSDKIKRHCEKVDFLSNFSDWYEFDIYNRKDTKKIFNSEIYEK